MGRGSMDILIACLSLRLTEVWIIAFGQVSITVAVGAGDGWKRQESPGRSNRSDFRGKRTNMLEKQGAQLPRPPGPQSSVRNLLISTP
jgi:hypothetical protein